MDPKPSQSGRFSPGLSRTGSGPSPGSSPLARSISAATSQSLSSILNNPHASDTSSWWSSSLPAPEFSPITPAKPGSELTVSDFKPYLSSISNSYSHFEDIRNHSNNEVGNSEGGGQGEALVACLREVPALYFKEDFALEEGATFRAACPFSSFAENLVLQEKLSQYLDVVEMHLVREISLRSDSFYEAQGRLEDLSGRIVEGCGRIRELRETVRLLDAELVDCARRIQGLSGTRGNLLVLQQKLRLILYVNQAISALKLVGFGTR